MKTYEPPQLTTIAPLAEMTLGHFQGSYFDGVMLVADIVIPGSNPPVVIGHVNVPGMSGGV